MANIYRSYLRLLEKWPVDPTKKKSKSSDAVKRFLAFVLMCKSDEIVISQRDLGQYIREQVKISFVCGEICLPEGEVKCKRTYDILNKFADNYYFDRYKRHLHSSATGLTAEQCKAVLSDDFLSFLKEDQEGYFSRVFKKRRDA